MGLEEQFTLNYPIETSKEAEKYSKECVKIAENFAIGFLEFEVGLLTKQVEGYFYFDYDNEWKTTKELLEIYKQTL